MTATSGPGFSLMQESIGLAHMMEINVSGPSHLMMPQRFPPKLTIGVLLSKCVESSPSAYVSGHD